MIRIRKEKAGMKKAGEVRIEWMNLKDMVGALVNPKDHDLGGIIESMQKWGVVGAVGVIDEASGRLVAGHGRRDALRGMKVGGMKAPMGVKVEDGDWYGQVWRGYEFESEEEARAFLIADNRTQERGGWKEDELATVMADLAARGDAMLVGTGFDAEDVDALVKRVMGNGNGKGEEEDGDNKQEDEQEYEDEQDVNNFGVEEGQVWGCGDQVVICGDCRDEGVWRVGLGSMQVLTGVKIDMVQAVICSPPYARQRDWAYGGVEMGKYLEWWDNVQANVLRHLAVDGSFFVNIKPHTEKGQRVLYVFDLVLAMVRQWQWMFVDEFCWERVGIPGSWPNRFRNGFEPVYQFSRSPKIKFRPKNVLGDEAWEYHWAGLAQSTGEYFNTSHTGFSGDGALPSNRISVKENVSGIKHEAAFPWKLPYFFIQAFSDEGDVCCDPFCGSGSTLVACQKAGRKGLGIEIVPKHVSETLRRLSVLTGMEVKRIS